MSIRLAFLCIVTLFALFEISLQKELGDIEVKCKNAKSKEIQESQKTCLDELWKTYFKNVHIGGDTRNAKFPVQNLIRKKCKKVETIKCSNVDLKTILSQYKSTDTKRQYLCKMMAKANHLNTTRCDEPVIAEFVAAVVIDSHKFTKVKMPTPCIVAKSSEYCPKQSKCIEKSREDKGYCYPKEMKWLKPCTQLANVALDGGNKKYDQNTCKLPDT